MKIKHFLAVMIMVLALASCNDEEGAPRMLWEVNYYPEQNVYAMAYIDYHPQIVIQTNNEAGEVTLTCTNYDSLQLHYGTSSSTQSISDPELNFKAEIIGENKIKITFEALPETYDVSTDAFLKIDGRNGTYTNMCVAKITRWPNATLE